MLDISSIFSATAPSYQKTEDLDFPVSKIRFFMDVLWQAVTVKPLTEEQKTTLKQLIELLNLLDEHKHQSEKELIGAMLPSISPLLNKMPTLGLTGTHVFAHLVPMYQLYLPTVEQMVRKAHAFTMEETLLYYQLTIFDHLFLVHLFEQEVNVNMIEILLTIKALILCNALVYDYQQNVSGRSISFFTFLMRGGLTSDQLLPFLTDTIENIKTEVKLTVTNNACTETLEFLSGKLLETTKVPPTEAAANEQKETTNLDEVMKPETPKEEVNKIFNQVTETPVEKPAKPVVEVPASVAPEPNLTETVSSQTSIPAVETPAAALAEPVNVTPTSTPTETETPVTGNSSPLSENPQFQPTTTSQITS